MNDGIDRSECGAGGTDQLGRCSFPGEIAGTPLGAGASILTLRSDRFQSLKT